MAQEWPHRSRLLRRGPRAAGQPIVGRTEFTDLAAQRVGEKARASGWFRTGRTSERREPERLHLQTSTSVGHVWAQPTGPGQPKPRIEGILVDGPRRNDAAAAPATEPPIEPITGENAMYNIAAIPVGDPAIEANVFGHPEFPGATLAENEAADLEGPAQHWSDDARAPVGNDRRLLDPR